MQLHDDTDYREVTFTAVFLLFYSECDLLSNAGSLDSIPMVTVGSLASKLW